MEVQWLKYLSYMVRASSEKMRLATTGHLSLLNGSFLGPYNDKTRDFLFVCLPFDK